jgi:hypothetical protein
MKLPHVRVQALLIAVAVVALLIWGVKMGLRSHDSDRRATQYAKDERGWRSIAARNRGWQKWGNQSADYYARLARNSRRAMWRP